MLREAAKRFLNDDQVTALKVATGRASRDLVDRNQTTFSRRAVPSASAELFEEIRKIPGYFVHDDVIAFTTVLRLQAALGVTGDLLEIGTFFGRSTVVLARLLGDGETLLACDPFEQETAYAYDRPPTRQAVEENLARVAPGAHVDLRQSTSAQLDLAGRAFRFVHVDGSHHYADVAFDLRLAADHLLPGGVIAIDDYRHVDFPDVTVAVDELRDALGLVEVVDANRHAEAGRKLYLARPA